MSLVRLLKAGKSLVGQENATSRYRMRSRFLLPKFGSSKNPFVSMAQTESSPPPAEARTKLARYQMTPAEIAAARLKETMKLPEAAPVAAGKKTVKPPVSAGVWNRLGGWLQRFNPLARLAKRNTFARPPGPASPRPPVQGELSLDKVKVMRNDLSDADVEIVPAKTSVKTKPSPLVPGGRRAELAETRAG